MKVSVIIPTRDKGQQLGVTLGCLLDQERPADEIVVVADGCTDRTADVAAAHAGVRLLTTTGVGRAGARNIGARAATSDVLVFLDDDILVSRRFVAAHSAAHSGGEARVIGANVDGAPRVVHGPLRELPGSRRLLAAPSADPYADAVSGAWGRTVVNSLERLVAAMAAGDAPPVAPWLTCCGGNVSLSRQLWRKAGGFDDGFGDVWGCEDLEFGYRLTQAGAAMAVAPDADGVHLTHVRPARWIEHAVNLDRFVTRHPDAAVAALPALLAADGRPADYLNAISEQAAKKEML